MNKSMLVGAVLGAVGVTAGGAVATYSLVDRGPDYAEVVAVQPVKETIKTPRQVCKDVAVTRQRPVKAWPPARQRPKQRVLRTCFAHFL